ncbi:hypothetical protein II906_02580 [bacterium]|nr:hypothetical protein [bacterium]
MQFDELRPILIDILTLPEFAGEYLSIRQICAQIEKSYPDLWQTLNNNKIKIKSNSGIVYNYSNQKASDFIAKTLEYYSMNYGIPGLESKEIQSINAKPILIWRIK